MPFSRLCGYTLTEDKAEALSAAEVRDKNMMKYTDNGKKRDKIGSFKKSQI